MFSYVARQPIIDNQQNLFAYELLFRDGEQNKFPDIDPDQATSNILSDNQLSLGVEKITGDLPAFINFHAETLIKSFPYFLDPNKVVIEILEDVPITDDLLNACKELREKGYRFALDDHDFDPKWDVFLPVVDFIKVDVLSTTMREIQQYVRRVNRYDITLLAEKVETFEQFAQLKMLGFEYFQGFFYAKPEIMKQKKVTTGQQAVLSLISQANSVSMDFNEVSAIFSTDPGLTYKLLRFINSPIYGRRIEITSLKHAISYIGELELKKFIALLALSDLSTDKCAEITRISLIRAKFCEAISDIRKDVNNPPKAFLTGILSMIDAILDTELDQVLDILPIDNQIRDALANKNNYLRHYIYLAKFVERGLWNKAEKVAAGLNINPQVIYQCHQDATNWADEMINKA